MISADHRWHLPRASGRGCFGQRRGGGHGWRCSGGEADLRLNAGDGNESGGRWNGPHAEFTGPLTSRDPRWFEELNGVWRDDTDGWWCRSRTSSLSHWNFKTRLVSVFLSGIRRLKINLLFFQIICNQTSSYEIFLSFQLKSNSRCFDFI